jgi:tocopherol cyclase
MRDPSYFKGKHQKKRYFEGWYFKCISADRKNAIAVIPGIAMDLHGDKHAFIQVINAVSGKTWYYHFAYDLFRSPDNSFEVKIAGNDFCSGGLSLDIDRPEGRIKGDLSFSDIKLFPSTWYNPGIMGPFSFVPFMECFHAIIHLYHQLHGRIELDGEILDFEGGIGYIEKDYGRSFPKTYLWLQASHFEHGSSSFVFSRARIPLLGFEFPGFFAYFSNFSDISVRFATYNGSRLEDWQVDPANGICSGKLVNNRNTLLFQAKMNSGGCLRAPIDGLMDRQIMESITAQVSIRLTDRRGDILFQGSSKEAGMEICL